MTSGLEARSGQLTSLLSIYDNVNVTHTPRVKQEEVKKRCQGIAHGRLPNAGLLVAEMDFIPRWCLQAGRRKGSSSS